MKNLVSFLRSKRFSQIIAGSFVVLFMLVTTACSQPNNPASNGKISKANVKADTKLMQPASPYRKDADNTPEGQITELYQSIQPVEGGMNNYSDVDPRLNTSKSDAKAKKIIQQAPHPEAKKFNGPLDAVKKELSDESIPERVQKLSDNVAQATKNRANDVSEETQKGLDNISESSKKLRNKTQSAAKTLSENTQKAAKSTGDSVKQTTDSIVSKAQRGVSEVQDFIDAKGDST